MSYALETPYSNQVIFLNSANSVFKNIDGAGEYTYSFTTPIQLPINTNMLISVTDAQLPNVIPNVTSANNKISFSIPTFSKFFTITLAEDDGTIRPKTIEELFNGVREIHFLSYLRYLYFNIGRIAYLQANVLSAYVFLAPAIVAGVVTLGVMQQIIRAFGRVEGSMQYILKAWPTIIELASVYKRLREFESKIKQDELIDEKV